MPCFGTVCCCGRGYRRRAMAIEKVKAYFREYWMEERIQEFDISSATVELAAK